jgi:hypothetical protein
MIIDGLRLLSQDARSRFQFIEGDRDRDALVRAGLKELQLRKVMHAIAPPLASSSLPEAATTS